MTHDLPLYRDVGYPAGVNCYSVCGTRRVKREPASEYRPHERAAESVAALAALRGALKRKRLAAAQANSAA